MAEAAARWRRRHWLDLQEVKEVEAEKKIVVVRPPSLVCIPSLTFPFLRIFFSVGTRKPSDSIVSFCVGGRHFALLCLGDTGLNRSSPSPSYLGGEERERRGERSGSQHVRRLITGRVSAWGTRTYREGLWISNVRGDVAVCVRPLLISCTLTTPVRPYRGIAKKDTVNATSFGFSTSKSARSVIVNAFKC